MKLTLQIIFFFITFNFNAQNSTLANKAIEQLGINTSDIKYDLIASKTFPNNKSETILIIPEIENEDKELDSFELNSHIVIVDTNTGDIKFSYFESSKTNNWISDAIILSDILIDTAPYILSKNLSAFGVRVNFYGMSKPNPYSNSTLSLFIKSENNLTKVLNNYTVSDYGGEWDMNCDANFIDAKKILIMTPKTSNGFFDILVKNKITEIKNYEDSNGDCIDKKETNTTKSFLRFDGKEYKETVL